MPPIVLKDVRDPRLAEYRDIPEPELVRARGLFVAEGRLVVERLIENPRWTIKSLLLSARAYTGFAPMLLRCRPDVPAYICGTSDFLAITGFDMHRGCLALAERPRARDLGALLASAEVRTVIVLEEIANADNVGGVFRNAAAFGAHAVLLTSGCCDPLYRKAVRTSVAAALCVPFARVDAWPADLVRLQTSGFTVVALTPRQPSETLSAFVARERPERLALVVGSESSGLSAVVEAAADRRVRIPIASDMDSLNLAVATGIALHCLARLLPPK